VPLLAGGGALVLAIALVLVWWFVMRGDGSVSTAKYANSACGDLSSWQGDIAKSAAAMTTAVGSAGDRHPYRPTHFGPGRRRHTHGWQELRQAADRRRTLRIRVVQELGAADR
jgi:hypothetical protein